MPKTCPYSRPGTLSADDAGELICRARKLLRKGLLSHRELVLFDCMLWSARKPGTDTAVIAYTALQRLAHISRETIAKGLRRLGQLGLMETIRRRVRVPWGGRVASRQMTSAYRFRPIATEFGGSTVIPEMKILYPVPEAQTPEPSPSIARIEAVAARARALELARRKEGSQAQ